MIVYNVATKYILLLICDVKEQRLPLKGCLQDGKRKHIDDDDQNSHVLPAGQQL